MSAIRPGLPDPLVNLLGARWAMGVPVLGVAWVGVTAGFALADGTLAVAQAQWEGAASLQPREEGGVQLVPATATPPPVMRAGVHTGPCLTVAAGDGVFITGGIDGKLVRTGPDGTTETLAGDTGDGVRCVVASNDVVVYAIGTKVHRLGFGAVDLPGPATALSFNPAGTVAIAHPGGVTMWSATGNTRLLPRPGAHHALAWSADGQHLVTGTEAQAHAWQLPAGQDMVLDGAGGAVMSVSYSNPGQFFATSGASRVTCWAFDGTGVARSECGVGSNVLVAKVACHPRRLVIAAGYDNGAVLLCQPGSADILFIRAAGGGAITTLAWSPDGAFLAFGAAGGEIGLIAFPELLFRPAAQREAA